MYRPQSPGSRNTWSIETVAERQEGRGGEGERGRIRDRHRERQRQRERQRHRETETQTEIQTERQRDRQRETDRETDREEHLVDRNSSAGVLYSHSQRAAADYARACSV